MAFTYSKSKENIPKRTDQKVTIGSSKFIFNRKVNTEKNEGNVSDVQYDESDSRDNDKTGSHAEIIGIGEHAKTNVIWHVISTTLIIFSCICCALIICNIYNINTEAVTKDMKDVWGIITPIITLSLGYLFGKIEKKDSKDDDK